MMINRLRSWLRSFRARLFPRHEVPGYGTVQMLDKLSDAPVSVVEYGDERSWSAVDAMLRARDVSGTHD